MSTPSDLTGPPEYVASGSGTSGADLPESETQMDQHTAGNGPRSGPTRTLP